MTTSISATKLGTYSIKDSRVVDGIMSVKVYKNLHTGNWSIMANEGQYKGLIIGHADAILLRNASQEINEAGRKRVIKEGVKNVHAFINGMAWFLEGDNEQGQLLVHYFEEEATPISYNPYRGYDKGRFYNKTTGEDIQEDQLGHVVLNKDGVFIVR